MKKPRTGGARGFFGNSLPQSDGSGGGLRAHHSREAYSCRMSSKAKRTQILNASRFLYRLEPTATVPRMPRRVQNPFEGHRFYRRWIALAPGHSTKRAPVDMTILSSLSRFAFGGREKG